MQYDYYIAARYRNKENVLALARAIRERGKTAYCFVESAASLKHVGGLLDDGEASMRQFEERENWWEDPGVREVFETDYAAIRAAHTFILLLPAGKSSHIEAGLAFGLGKRCILVGEQPTAESLYLIFHEHYDTAEDFLTTLN